ncbi:bifunctional riboflavin kinase/FMN adenylyltransferase [Lentibacillus amyloliquefaciens]|uniref:Riboflavin biosynthesis protein n=2 Tax=Lentibacillus amyloliquefaciens TaxID=1472767 RepID=A0A0U4F423_9BACI|nr:bifunctional riboflavin kinase/FAD synthetase [Lentibacillus amyloliquefaciens]ALX47475.1 bifunctional riboflavin kinase/FMN adenylyltransferase [Lentibacillus amyloliquefaciens]
MRTIRLTYPHTLLMDELPETVAAIGFFDGVHKGHQQLINTAVNKARDDQMESAVITFHPHPSVVLKKGVQYVQYITPLREKQKVLQQLGVDRLYIITFDKDLSSLEPQTFVEHFIINLNIKHLVAGFDFSYGHKGLGNVQTLGDHAKGMFDYTVVEKVRSDDQKISSTRIRELMKSGNIKEANNLLGRPLIVRGVVEEGEKRGRAIGYPTANIKVSQDALLPRIGVYAVKVLFKNEVYEGMASLGYNPTFTSDRETPIVEVNIFDYNNDLYGEELVVEWHKYIRDEVKFESAEKLVEQIDQDEKDIRNYFYRS